MKLVLALTFFFFFSSDFSGASADLVIETIDVESSLLLSHGSREGPPLQPDGQEFFSKGYPSCIAEKGIQLVHTAMADTSKFKEETLQRCVAYCLESHPDKSFVLISLYNAAIFGDQFNCICSNAEGFADALEAPGKCRIKCPSSNKYRCGDAKNNFMSVYCIHRSCRADGGRTPICGRRMPHDSHGCVRNRDVTWTEAHNVRNFSAATNGPTACVWECRDNHPHSMYSLTRKVGPVLTCSCGYPSAVNARHTVPREFCSMLPRDEDAPYYTLNCVNDLDEGDEEMFLPSERCTKTLPFGCIYEEFLLKNDLVNEITLTQNNGNSSSSSAPAAPAADPTDCQRACYALFPNAYFVGVRQTDDDGSVKCFCAKMGAFKSKMMGPKVACDRDCGPEGAGFNCGGGADKGDSPPALSLYCIKGRKNTNNNGTGDSDNDDGKDSDEDNFIDVGVSLRELRSTRDSLARIMDSMRAGNLSADIIVVLLTLLLIALVSVATYICTSQGVCELSRYA